MSAEFVEERVCCAFLQGLARTGCLDLRVLGWPGLCPSSWKVSVLCIPESAWYRVLWAPRVCLKNVWHPHLLPLREQKD